ncbi:hypothetical protein SBY92_004993 [Candida maltosa Xu316]|uniref:Uncharacterized protein n=1 Tax=Candida maltosa (strain Xu316) TaxID=1245528 RepID=M3JT64_CANMX|nr:hypothetical protein G210_4327 [Candida maltosa Xu316]
MLPIILILSFFFSFIAATPVTAGTRANITLYLESTDSSINNQVLYSANQDNTIHFYYIGDESISFATTFMYDGTKNTVYERQEGSSDRYYLTILDSMLRGQLGSGLQVTLNTDGSLDFAGSDHLYAYKMGDGSIKFLVLLFASNVPSNVVPVKLKARTNWATL